MPDPKSMDELTVRTQRNIQYKGFGSGTRTIMPCPICGAAGWLVFPITAGMNDYADVQQPTKCKECKRVIRLIIERTQAGVTMEVVQTDGPEPPAWMTDPPRRVSDGA